MAVFPENISPSIPVVIKQDLRVIYTETDTGIEYRRRKWRFPKREVSLTFNNLKEADAETIKNFLRARYLSYESFYWFDYVARNWIDEFVGRGDGTVIRFTLPGKEIDSTSLSVYIDGVLDTNYTFIVGSGVNGEDQIEFTTAPANGALITADFTGKLRLKCRLATSSFDYVHKITTYRSISITLKEVFS